MIVQVLGRFVGRVRERLEAKVKPSFVMSQVVSAARHISLWQGNALVIIRRANATLSDLHAEVAVSDADLEHNGLTQPAIQEAVDEALRSLADVAAPSRG